MKSFGKASAAILGIVAILISLFAFPASFGAASIFDEAVPTQLATDIIGTLDAGESKAYYAELSKSGYVTVSVTGAGCRAAVYNADGIELLSVAPGDACPKLGLPAEKIYLVLNASDSVSFTARIDFTEAPGFETELNNTPAAADTLAPGGSVTGSLCFNTDVDCYSFTITNSGYIEINIPTNTERAYSVQLLSGDTKLYTCELASSPKIGLPAGTYILRVLPINYTSNDYTLSLGFTAEANRETEPNDGTATADAITVNTGVKGSISSALDKDCYIFALPTMANTAFEISAPGLSFSAYELTVFDSARSEVFHKTVSNSFTSEKIALDKGNYTAEITPIVSSFTSADYTFTVHTYAGTVTDRIAGQSRIDTAIAISRSGWADGSTDSVIIANGFNFPDALAGVPLAYALDAPILLSEGKVLESAIANEIERLGAKNVYLLGGEYVVAPAVADQLAAKSFNVTRVAGMSRLDTAVEIAKKLEEIKGKSSTVFIAQGFNYPDALSISPIAALMNSPILYSDPNGDVGSVTSNYVKSKGFTSAELVGGEFVVSKKAESDLKGFISSVTRVAGQSRFDTSAAICTKYASLFDLSEMSVASGANFPDALAGGVYAAKNRIPMLLVCNDTSLCTSTVNFIKNRKPAALHVFGGEYVVTPQVLDYLSK